MSANKVFVFFALLGAFVTSSCTHSASKESSSKESSSEESSSEEDNSSSEEDNDTAVLFSRGYENKLIRKNTYSVKLRINRNMAPDTIDKAVQRQSAQLTLKNNFDYYYPTQRTEQRYYNISEGTDYGIGINQIIILYKEGEQPKGAFRATAVLEKTTPQE